MPTYNIEIKLTDAEVLELEVYMPKASVKNFLEDTCRTAVDTELAYLAMNKTPGEIIEV